jgi:hypothetical protein
MIALLFALAAGLALFAAGSLLTSRDLRRLTRRVQTIEALLVERWGRP